MSEIKIALATDSNAFQPTMVAMLSVIRYATKPVHVYFFAHNLTVSEIEQLHNAVATHPSAQLHFCELTDGMFEGAIQKSSYISLVTLARMYIPKLVKGKVLYLDGDTITLGDVTPLFELNMGRALIAAVPDTFVLSLISSNKWRRKYSARVQYFTNLMRPKAPHHYFNAGVLLIDCDRIRANGNMTSQMTDMVAASNFELLDQDYLNFLFKDRVLLLDPSWNCFWGRLRRARKYMHNFSYPHIPAKEQCTQIMHFPGSKKPWHRLSLRTFTKRYWAVRQYRRLYRELLAEVTKSS